MLAKTYKAYSDLYMVEPANLQASQAMSNDVSLLQTSLVEAAAIADLHQRVGLAAFSYSGIAASDVILEIQVSAGSQVAAIKYANALDTAFLKVRAEQITKQTGIIDNALSNQVNLLNDDITVLSGSISALSTAPAGAQSASEIAGIVNQRSADQSQIAQLQTTIQDNQLSETSVIRGSEVLDPAVPFSTGNKKTLEEDSLSGLVGGLGVALGIIVFSGMLSERPRRRDEVAAALGCSVELSVGAYRPPRLFSRARLRRRLRHPDATVRMIARRLRNNLEAGGPPALAVVEVEAAQSAALAVGALAMLLASEGKNVLLIDTAEGRPLGSLLCHRRPYGVATPIQEGGRQLTMLVAPADPAVITNAPVLPGTDVVLILGTSNPGLGAAHLAAWADRAVVVLGGGKASLTRVVAAGQLLRNAGIPPRSAVLVGARPEDETLGAVENPDAPLAAASVSRAGPSERGVGRRRADLIADKATKLNGGYDGREEQATGSKRSG
jgi:hypothetical protein